MFIKTLKYHIYSTYTILMSFTDLAGSFRSSGGLSMGMLPLTEPQGAIIFGVTVLEMNPDGFYLYTGCITMAMLTPYFS